MSDAPQGPGWWLASDGRYYPPAPPSPPSSPPTTDLPPEPGQAWMPAGPPGAAAPGAPPPFTGTAAPFPAPGTPPPQGARSSGARTVLVVLGVLVGVVLIGLVALVAVVALARGGDDEQQAVESPVPTVPTTVPTSEVPAEPSAPEPGSGPVRVSESGFTTGEGFDGELAANAGAVLDNTGDDTHAFFEVVFTFVDADGRAVGTETAYVYAIDPGGTAHASVDSVSLQGPAAEVRVAVVLDDVGFWTGRTLPVEVGPVTIDEFFGLEVSGTASNPDGPTAQGASVQCVVRQGDRIVGGTSALLDSIEAGGQVAWEAITFSDFLRGDSAECSGSVYE